MTSEDLNLAEWFAEMARHLLSRDDVADTLNETCRLAVAAITHCQEAGISQVHRGQRIDTPAATNQIVADLHILQYELNDGPCMEAAWEEQTVHIQDMNTDERWPRFARAAAGRGVQSMLCFQLFTDDDTFGALNLFSDTPHAFDEYDNEVGLIFASHAAVALAEAQTQAGLKAAIITRQQIGEAVGILSERHNITTAQAFSLLAQASQHRNTPLRDIAARLVETENANRK
ncbi:MAG TPA: GAF and ANTAR domain-containing protein [Mycobacteriales bacterium]|nr:GAF and ANTAR domain-containing protein [Mycobacteriales bacterium]